MKILATLAALLLFALSPAMAQSTSGSQSGSWSQSGVSIGSATQAPSAIAPGLIAGGLSCSGSASIGGSGAGWGLSLGITKEDKHCNAREDAKYIDGILGNKGAAMARLCMVKENREAFRLAGTPCPQEFERTQVRKRTNSPSATKTVVKRSFNSMAACRRYARSHPEVTCQLR